MFSSECTIVKGKNYSYADEYMVNFGWDEVGMFMDREKRNSLNFQNYTIMLRKVKPMRTILFNFDNLVANELVTNPQGVFLTDHLIVKSRSVFVYHFDMELTMGLKVFYLFKVVLCFVVISIVTTLYIYGTIVAAPAVIIMILRACNSIRGEGFNDVYKLFPWIGTHAIIRDTSTNPTIK
jgi:hypothetical protein